MRADDDELIADLRIRTREIADHVVTVRIGGDVVGLDVDAQLHRRAALQQPGDQVVVFAGHDDRRKRRLAFVAALDEHSAVLAVTRAHEDGGPRLAHGLRHLPRVRRILPSVKRQLEEILAIPAEEAIEASAKVGIGIEEILEAIVSRIPPPEKPADETLRALVFDSVFDVYRGVIGHVRVVSGKMEPDQAIRMMSNDGRYEIKEVGVFTPKMYPQTRLNAGDAVSRGPISSVSVANIAGACDRSSPSARIFANIASPPS